MDNEYIYSLEDLKRALIDSIYPYPYPDETLNAIYQAQADLIRLDSFVNKLLGAVVLSAIMAPGGRRVVYTVIIVVCWPWDCPKRTVYYWKYTAHHINEPARKVPADLLDVIV